MKQTILIVIGLMLFSCSKEKTQNEKLIDLLGVMPEKPELQIDTLETVKLENGTRYKISYLSEPAGGVFDEPEDRIKAYLFVPNGAENKKLPAMIAIHQDGGSSHIGKLETAGLAGQEDMHYGKELFDRGYIVICPDRLNHAERRRIHESDTLEVNADRDMKLFEFWGAQLLLKGRSVPGKMAYDLSRATDVLYTMDCIDQSKIGAIGHSGGGVALLYFMAYDERVKLGVSSCGLVEFLDYFDQNSAQRPPAAIVIPGLAEAGGDVAYLSSISPRPMLLTRGKSEYGKWNDMQIEYSKRHVASTEKMVAQAKTTNSEKGVENNIEVIYFDENNGQHSFPPKVKEEVFNWIDNKI
ncbi:S9 family peptidase [Flammeovirga sp. SJP92]|uniref:alpha/beta hydrolase family protein n=1 Tax=Flammeovirga sp. SJP92 TaxID=1775430 RepID=UPI0012FCC371|nr:alpha/beta fold hydrolase [Flammeovirga sp. SJP92]